jgi:endonuclease YncB( thermonuclease family)
MDTGLRRTGLKVALGAFLAVAGMNGVATAQNLDAGSIAGTAPDRSPGNAVSGAAAMPDTPVGKRGPAASVMAAAPGPASGTRSELIHLPTLSAAGLIEKGGWKIRLAGVVPTSVDAECGSGFDAWPCGRMAQAAVQRFLRRRSVECRMPETAGPADGVAHCSVAGRDIGEWIVAQGWARSDGSGYADAEKTAREEKRGIWSPLRPGFGSFPVFDVSPELLATAAVRAEVHLSSQSMTLVHRGRIVAEWPVSTARIGKETPTGVWTAKWLSRNHRSSLYDDAPMPWSVFYDGDYAVHGTYQTGRLGSPASAGCVRLAPKHAAVLFNLVSQEGLDKTLIVIRP